MTLCVCVCVVVLTSALSGLTPEQHAEVRNTLDEVIMSVSTLRGEVADLRDCLRDIPNTIIEEIRSVHQLSVKTQVSSPISGTVRVTYRTYQYGAWFSASVQYRLYSDVSG